MSAGGRGGVELRVEGLVKRYRGVVALDGVSLVVGPGELLTLLGPSGCGKTTILRSVAGFVKPDAGRVRLDGVDLLPMPPHRRRVGLVFQHYALFPHMTVLENVAFGLKMQGVGRAEREHGALAALDLVSLRPMAGRYPRQLSGGQQQRVALARVLAARPRLLLLDEPFGALDRKLRLQLQVELKRLVQDLGLTTLFVTHDQEEALTLSDRIAVMREGRIEQVGRPMEVYDHPESAFVADFVGTTNLLEGAVSDANRLLVGRALALPLPDPAGRWRAGQRVLAVLRPERVEVSAQPFLDSAEAATGELRVGFASHLGTHSVYELDLPDSSSPRLLAVAGRLPGVERGSSVYVRVRPGAIAAVFPVGSSTPAVAPPHSAPAPPAPPGSAGAPPPVLPIPTT